MDDEDRGSTPRWMGDALFAGSIGRVDFPNSDGERLMQNIRDKLMALPDETRVLAPIRRADGGTDLWIRDVERGVATRVTSATGMNNNAVWSPNDEEVFFVSSQSEDGVPRPYRKALDSSESASRLLDTSEPAWTEEVTPDGKTLVYLTGTTPNDSLWALPLDGEDEPERLMKVDYAIDEPHVSPDGRWLAYSANVTGDWEVYVMPFRRPGAKVRVSPQGGRQPRWRGDGRELFYVTAAGELMAVDVEPRRERLVVSLPQRLFEAGVSSVIADEYNVTKDGQRFLVITPVEASDNSLNVTLNWTSLLEQ